VIERFGERDKNRINIAKFADRRETTTKDLDDPADTSLGRSHLEHQRLAIMQINSIPGQCLRKRSL
jgi:hypothetical protein